MEEEALDSTLWKTRFSRGYGPVVRQRDNDQETEHISERKSVPCVYLELACPTFIE